MITLHSPTATGATRMDVGARTNLPRWSDIPPEPDPRARCHTLVSFSPDAMAVADTWASSAASLGASVRRLHADRFDSHLAAALEAHLADAVVGWRLMLIGPEADILAAQALAFTFGVIPAEIRAHATSATRRRVRCAHCALTTEADLPVGETLPCPGCGRTLVVHHHLSRRHAAYLGYHADAEVMT